MMFYWTYADVLCVYRYTTWGSILLVHRLFFVPIFCVRRSGQSCKPIVTLLRPRNGNKQFADTGLGRGQWTTWNWRGVMLYGTQVSYARKRVLKCCRSRILWRFGVAVSTADRTNNFPPGILHLWTPCCQLLFARTINQVNQNRLETYGFFSFILLNIISTTTVFGAWHQRQNVSFVLPACHSILSLITVSRVPFTSASS